MSAKVLVGDCRSLLSTLPAESAQTCVTSPPYFNLRDYGHAGQIGLEETPEDYVQQMVGVFREVRRVLRKDGTLWLNLGDSYGAGKQLLGIPWRVAEALKADGWVLRCDIVWAKPSVMPDGSAHDRPTRSHEYVFLFGVARDYMYDAEAIREERHPEDIAFSARYGATPGGKKVISDRADGGGSGFSGGFPCREDGKRNARSVWTISTKRFSGQHTAPMPWDLAERCVLAGSRAGDTVLDPFTGSGTVGMVARRHGRAFVGCELNPAYAAMARDRITGDAPLFNSDTEAA